jgi:hypothetical protein
MRSIGFTTSPAAEAHPHTILQRLTAWLATFRKATAPCKCAATGQECQSCWEARQF